MALAKKVLFIYNDPIAPEAMLGAAFAECGYDIQSFEVVPAARAEDPALDVVFPDPRGYDVIVPLGARWSVNDEHQGLAWIASEVAMVRDAHAAEVPILGVCFGGQLLAHALGGSVLRSAAPEIGWYEIDTDRADLIGPGPWFQWHFDRWSLPPGATEIARNGNASQAFVLGRSMGIQFHPELDTPLLELWLADDKEGAVAHIGTDADQLRSATAEELDRANARVHRLVKAFVTEIAQG